MNRLQSAAQLLVPALVVAMALVLVSGIASAQETPPGIPHPLEGRDACLGCHEAGLAGAPQVPADHAGRTNDMCRVCHQPATPAAEAPAATPSPPSIETPSAPALSMPHSLEGHQNCLECHSSAVATPGPAGGPPPIPHPLEGRQECLACHREGIGGAPQIPEDHAGRTSDVCQGCHQPQQAAEVSPTPAPSGPIPTRIAHPQAAGMNTCVDCHSQLGGTSADMAAQWQRSIHSERDVSCADCHGGDPTATTKEAAMSPAAGFIGAPAKSAIPALCASCHADVELMRQYNLPTDQYAKYNESVHGKLLAEGDTNVTTCYDCHGGHQILKANDPASSVYPSNVPTLCARCHSDSDFMAPYHIPTDQYDLYRESVHGQALIDKQDLRAPTCATCHGTHGAAPPGVTEVANVCGGCHSATQDYYLKSAHAKGGGDSPRCVTCHGPHDVSQPTDALLAGTEPRHCEACHTPDSAEGKVAGSMSDAFASTTQAYADAENSIKSAQQLGMLVTQQESELQKVNTGIITARAAQHTLDSDTVVKTLDEARKTADGAKAGAEAAIAQSNLRRRAMVIAVAAIALTIVALYLLKRQLDRRLAD
jgi:Cytochrome c3